MGGKEEEHILPLSAKVPKWGFKRTWTFAKTHAWSYVVMIMLTKKSYFAVIIESAQSHTVGLSQTVKGLLQSGPLEVEVEHFVTCSDLFSNYFAVKMDSFAPSWTLGWLFRVWMCWTILLVHFCEIAFRLGSPRSWTGSLETNRLPTQPLPILAS